MVYGNRQAITPTDKKLQKHYCLPPCTVACNINMRCITCACVCVCVCVFVRACVRARTCVCVFICKCMCACGACDAHFQGSTLTFLYTCPLGKWTGNFTWPPNILPAQSRKWSWNFCQTQWFLKEMYLPLDSSWIFVRLGRLTAVIKTGKNYHRTFAELLEIFCVISAFWVTGVQQNAKKTCNISTFCIW